MRGMVIRALALAAAAAVGAGTVALGHSGATGVVKERMDLMKELGASMKALSQQAAAPVPDGDAVRAARRTITGHADRLAGMFPEGSDMKPSEAAPAVWTDRAGFDALLGDMRAAAASLPDAPDGAELSAGVTAIAATCKACHKSYRIKN